MPDALKTLVNIAVWILFVLGCVAILVGLIDFIGGTRLEVARAWGVGIVSLMFCVIGAWFRKTIG